MKQLQITIKTFIQAFLISIIALKIFFMIRVSCCQAQFNLPVVTDNGKWVVGV